MKRLEIFTATEFYNKLVSPSIENDQEADSLYQKSYENKMLTISGVVLKSALESQNQILYLKNENKRNETREKYDTINGVELYERSLSELEPAVICNVNTYDKDVLGGDTVLIKGLYQRNSIKNNVLYDGVILNIEEIKNKRLQEKDNIIKIKQGRKKKFFDKFGKLTGVYVDERDGQEYLTIQIGAQTWMAENLNYNTSIGCACNQNIEINCHNYGKLYNWEAAQKAVPKGWHLPSKYDYEQLISNIDYYDGLKLKEQLIGENGKLGFNCISPIRHDGVGQQFFLYYWTSTKYFVHGPGASYAFIVYNYVSNYNDESIRSELQIERDEKGNYVRCIRD